MLTRRGLLAGVAAAAATAALPRLTESKTVRGWDLGSTDSTAYYRISELPLMTRRYEYGEYADEVLAVYYPTPQQAKRLFDMTWLVDEAKRNPSLFVLAPKDLQSANWRMIDRLT